MTKFIANREATREELIASAAEYAGVPPTAMDGIWRTETNRSKHKTLVGPETKWGTAKGHFQQLDSTVNTWSQRLGKQLDPFDFADSVTILAEQMKENMTRYGAVDKAVAAYHGGTNQKNWGPKTKDYVAKVLGGAQLDALPQAEGGGYAKPAGQLPKGKPRVKDNLTAQEAWDGGALPAVTAADVTGTKDPKDQPELGPRLFGFQEGATASTATRTGAIDTDVAKQAEIDARPFLGLYDSDTVLGAAYQGTLNPAFQFFDRLNRDPNEKQADPIFQKAIREDWTEAVKGFDEPWEHEVLLNSVNQSELDSNRFHLEEQRRNRKVVNEAGAAGVGAQLLAGMMDPTTYVVGIGAMKAMHMTGKGAIALAQGGRAGAAIGSSVVENAAGNVAYDALQQVWGEHKTADDYMLSAATGLLPAALSAPGLVSSARSKLISDNMAAQHAKLVAVQNDLGPGATPDQIKAELTRRESEAIRVSAREFNGDAAKANDTGVTVGDVEADLIDGKFKDDPEVHPELTKGAGEPVSPAKTTEPAEPGVTEELSRTRMAWRTTPAADVPGGRKMGTYLDSVIASNPGNSLGVAATWLKQVSDPALWDIPVRLHGNAREHVDLAKGYVSLKSDSTDFTILHEAIHVATGRQIQQFLTKADGLGPQTKAGVKQLDKLFKRTKSQWETAAGRKVGKDASDHVEYGFRNLHEFAAQALSSKKFQNYLATLPGTLGEDAAKRSAWKDFLAGLKDVLGLKTDKATALDEATRHLDAIISARDTTFVNTEGKVQAFAPGSVDPIAAKYGLDLLPAHSPIERATKKALIQLYKDAEAWVQANPRNDEAVKALGDTVHMVQPATKIAQSDNPVARYVSGVLLEQSMGAHGRKANVAVAAHTLNLEYVGAFLNVNDQQYAIWRNAKYGKSNGAIDDIRTSRYRREFQREVFLEIEARQWDRPGSTDPQVKAVADAAEKQFEAMRVAQQQYKTPGFMGLPDSSRGYVPHLLDSSKVASLSLAKKRALHNALKEQFMLGMEDMDEDFADRVAGIYLQHATNRAAGLSQIPANPVSQHASEYVMDALKKANLTEQEIHEFMGKLSRGAASHTKKRLKMDVTKVYKDDDGTDFMLADLFRHDMNDIIRGHARRVAGEVALTKFGVAGSSGLKLIQQALAIPGAGLDKQQHEAVSQVFSELLGRPVNAQAENMWMDGLHTLTSLQNMGGMGIMQFAEYTNVALVAGLDSMLGSLGAIPRMRREIAAIRAGKPIKNGILDSLEPHGGGGEFGMDGYRMISGYDTTGREFEAFGQEAAGPTTRLLKRASYGLGIVTMNRAIQGVQQRGVAEQIVLKALRQFRDGTLDLKMKDMGFTPELLARVKADLPNATVWAGNRVKEFDITKFTDEGAREAFSQAVRRGVFQTIQGTFVGERGWWAHGNLSRFLTQFRGYPITAMEKQYGRQRVIHGGGWQGHAAAAGMILSAAGLALPIYAARIAANSLGREDADEYIDKMLSTEEVLKNLMNYISMTGMAQDVVAGLYSAAGQVNADWEITAPSQDRTGSLSGGSASSIIPGLATLDKALKLPGQTDDPYRIVKNLPYSNLPYLTPFINMMKGD